MGQEWLLIVLVKIFMVVLDSQAEFLNSPCGHVMCPLTFRVELPSLFPNLESSVQHYDRLNPPQKRVSLGSVFWPHIRDVDSHLHFCYNEKLITWIHSHTLSLALRDFLDPPDMPLRVCMVIICWVLPQSLRRSV